MNFLIPVIAGLTVGVIAGYFIARHRHRDLETKVQLERLQSEFNDYRTGVRSHFVETVSLLSQIDERQKELYKSIASGVAGLCYSNENGGDDYFLERSARALGQVEEDGDVKFHKDGK